MHAFIFSFSTHILSYEGLSRENTGLGAGHGELRAAEHPHSGALIIQKEIRASEPPGELVKAQGAGPHSRVPDLATLGRAHDLHIEKAPWTRAHPLKNTGRLLGFRNYIPRPS